VVKKRPLPPFDVQVPVGSLPRVFGTKLETIPANVPYLQADPACVERWRAHLSAYPGLKVGIAWHGNTTFHTERVRSIPLENFATLAALDGVRLVSLQKQPGTERLDRLAGRFEIVDFGPALDTQGAFLDTAAIMKSLDLVISSDTAVAHLAGALGVPTWIALPLFPDWRWFLDRDDSPWYPTMRLFRQTQLGRWSDVFERMAAELQALPKRPAPAPASP
jgi:hypothetical protein